MTFAGAKVTALFVLEVMISCMREAIVNALQTVSREHANFFAEPHHACLIDNHLHRSFLLFQV